MASLAAAASGACYYKALILGFLLLVGGWWVGGADAQPSCGTVTSYLAPCLGYLTKGAPKPAPGSACCAGVKKLNGLASSKPARQAICQCLEKSAGQVKPLSASVSALPGLCGVPFPYSFSTTQDCSKIA